MISIFICYVIYSIKQHYSILDFHLAIFLMIHSISLDEHRAYSLKNFIVLHAMEKDMISIQYLLFVIELWITGYSP